MANKKRGHGEGSIYQRSSGSWRAQIIIDGKRVGKTFKQKSDALNWLRKMQSQVEQGFDYFGSMISIGRIHEPMVGGCESRTSGKNS